MVLKFQSAMALDYSCLADFVQAGARPVQISSGEPDERQDH